MDRNELWGETEKLHPMELMGERERGLDDDNGARSADSGSRVDTVLFTEIKGVRV